MTSGNPANLPWYPSINPYEHFDAGRTHCFRGATFGGAFESGAQNQVRVRNVECPIPTPFNVAIRESDELFVYGGGYGDVGYPPGPPGSLVAKLDANDLSVRWWQQLSLTRYTNQWDYPGTVAVHRNGYVYCIFIDQLSKLCPETGELLRTTLLPALSTRENTACNGFTGLPGGTIVSKNLSRQNGCTAQGFSAFTQCEAADIPDTTLVTVDPESMDVIDVVKGPEPASGRITATRFHGVDYVYLVGFQSIYRYRAVDGKLTMDESWGPISYLQPGQRPAAAIAVLNDFVVFNTNAAPGGTAPMSIWAYSQENDEVKQRIEPFDDKDGQESFLPAMVSVDPDNSRIYAMNTGTGQFAGIHIDPDDPDLLSLEWMVAQTSYSYTSLVNPGDRRVIVASDIPKLDLPGSTYTTPYETEQVVWRAAEDGRELARSPLLPAMSQGAALSPGASGAIYYPAASGHVIEVSVAPSS